MIVADFTIDVAPPLVLVFMVLWLVALVVAVALARQGALNDASMTEADALAAVRPSGGVRRVDMPSSVELADELRAWCDDLLEAEAGR